MTTSDFEIVPIEKWPESVAPPKKAILDFLDSGEKIAIIKGQRDFLINVRRAAKANKELDNQVELKMVNNQMYIRRREHS